VILRLYPKGKSFAISSSIEEYKEKNCISNYHGSCYKWTLWFNCTELKYLCSTIMILQWLASFFFKSTLDPFLFPCHRSPRFSWKRSRLVYKTFTLNASKTARRQRLDPLSYIYLYIYMYISEKMKRTALSLCLSLLSLYGIVPRFYNTPVGFPSRGLTRSDISLRPRAPAASDGFQGILSGKDQPLIIADERVLTK